MHLTTDTFQLLSGDITEELYEEDDDPEGRWIPFAEPVPDWEKARERWSFWWEVHVYGTAAAFILVAIFTATNIILYIMKGKTNNRAYYIVLNVLVFILSVSRAIFMFLDAYNVEGSLHPALAYVFLSISLPCFTSSFYLIFVAWMKATKMRRTHAVHKTKTMVIVIVIHFVASAVFDITAGFTLHAVYLLIACQVCFVAFGYSLAIMFFYLYVRVYRATVKPRKAMLRISQRSTQTVSCSKNDVAVDQQSTQAPTDGENGTSRQCSQVSENLRIKVPLAARLLLVSATQLLIMATMYVVGIFFLYTRQVLTGKNPKPWSWYAYELLLRLCEIGLCCTVALAASLPVTKGLKRRLSRKMHRSLKKLIDGPSKKYQPDSTSSFKEEDKANPTLRTDSICSDGCGGKEK